MCQLCVVYIFINMSPSASNFIGVHSKGVLRSQNEKHASNDLLYVFRNGASCVRVLSSKCVQAEVSAFVQK